MRSRRSALRGSAEHSARPTLEARPADVVIDGDQLDRRPGPRSWSTPRSNSNRRCQATTSSRAHGAGREQVREARRHDRSLGDERSAPRRRRRSQRGLRSAADAPPIRVFRLGSSRTRVIEQLAATHDVVIIDTPPLLPVSDARAISEHVEAALIVCGLKTTRRRNLRSLRKILAILPAPVLGVVVTGVSRFLGMATTVIRPRPHEATETMDGSIERRSDEARARRPLGVVRPPGVVAWPAASTLRIRYTPPHWLDDEWSRCAR